MPNPVGGGHPQLQPAHAFTCSPYWLSRGLVAMASPRWRSELARGRIITPTGSPAPLVDALGVCYSTGVNSKYYSVTLPELAAPVAWTVVALVKSTGGSGGSSNTIACINYDGTTVPLNLNLSVQSVGGTPAGASIFSGSWDSCLNITDINNDNLWHVVGGVFSKQAARLEFWLDGKLNVAGTTTHDPSSHTNTNPLDIATYRNDARTFIGSIAGVAVFNQALYNAELEALTGTLNGIWQIAAPISRKVYFVDVTGGSSTTETAVAVDQASADVVVARDIFLYAGLANPNDVRLTQPNIGAGDLLQAVEAASAADSPSAQVDFAATLAEAGSAADAPSTQVDFAATDAEAGAALDAPSALDTLVASTSETATALDTESATTAYALAVAETGAAVDAPVAQVDFAAADAEVSAATDTSSELDTGVGSVAEVGAAADSESAQVDFAASVDETAAAVDAPAIAGTSVDEVAVAADTASAQVDIGAGVAVQPSVPTGGDWKRFSGRVRRHTTNDPPKVKKRSKKIALASQVLAQPPAPLLAPDVRTTEARELAERLAAATSDAAKRTVEQALAARESKQLVLREKARLAAAAKAQAADKLRLEVEAYNIRVLTELLLTL